jgi:hypothetical protein
MILGHLPRSPLPPRPEQRLKLIERTQGVTHTLLRGRLARSSTLIAQHVRTHFRNGLTSPPSIGGLHRKRRSGAPDCRKADISKSCNRLARAQQRQKLEQTSTSMDDHALAIRRSGQDRVGRSCPGARRPVPASSPPGLLERQRKSAPLGQKFHQAPVKVEHRHLAAALP